MIFCVWLLYWCQHIVVKHCVFVCFCLRFDIDALSESDKWWNSTVWACFWYFHKLSFDIVVSASMIEVLWQNLMSNISHPTGQCYKIELMFCCSMSCNIIFYFETHWFLYQYAFKFDHTILIKVFTVVKCRLHFSHQNRPLYNLLLPQLQ